MKKITLKNIKEKDVFHFRPKDCGEFANWCRENLFIARKDEKGKIYFTDTYWGYGEGENKRYTFQEANKLGSLEYRFNLSEVEEIKDYQRVYYNDEDIYHLTNQHACSSGCINYFIKKGTPRNPKKMLDVIDKKISTARHEIDNAVRDIEQLAEKKTKLEAGDLTIYTKQK